MAEHRTPAQLVEELRAEQCARWQRGDHVPAEDYLRRHPALQEDADNALKLIYQELLLREREGEAPLLGEYLGRFPQFAAQLRPLFAVHQALENEEPFPLPARETPRDWDLP